MGPQIDFQALIQGKRLQSCSDRARLLFPYLFMGSNSLGRLELDVEAINDNILVAFKTPLAPSEFWLIIQEYRTHHLMFVYRAGRQMWGQWFVKEGYLPKYQTKRDTSTPPPPEEPFKAWSDSYKNHKISEIPAFFQEVPEILENFGPREERCGVEECGVEKRRKPKTHPPSSEVGAKEPTPIRPSMKPDYKAEFEKVWAVSWAKRGKGAAKNAFVKARQSGVSFETILEQVKTQGPILLSEARQNRRTPVYLATWLNQGRHDDDPLFNPATPARAAPAEGDDGLDWGFLEEDKPRGKKGEHAHV